MQEKIRKAVTDTLARLGAGDTAFAVEWPADLSHGDYAVNAAMAAAKKLGKNPKEVAEEIAAVLRTVLGEDASRVEVAGPGFVNIALAPQVFSESVSAILKADGDWGKNDSLADKRIIVEYSQPNPFKPFHIGHLMSTAIGESLSRLVEFSGATIKRFNYHGDIGPHVAKGIWGLQKEGLDPHSVEDLGKAYVIGTAAYEDDPKAKEEIDSINTRLYEGDPALKEIYETGKATSLARFAELYKILGSHFDYACMESETVPLGLAVVKDGLAKGIFEVSDGATVFRGEPYGLHTRVFITSRGTPLYETKELGFVQYKRERFPFDLNITTVAIEQDSYFKVVEKAIDLLWPESVGKYTHVPHGMMQLAGGKMSSRKGNVITGESLLEAMRENARTKMEGRDLGAAHDDVVDAVAVAAIKYAVLRQATGKNIVFDPEQSLSFEGDSGPYLQYANTRALSVLAKAEREGIAASASGGSRTEATELERLLYRFPDVVLRSEQGYEPHHLTTYLTELAGAFNSWYAREQIVDANDTSSPYKVAVTKAFAQTMENGLWLLGIRAPERM